MGRFQDGHCGRRDDRPFKGQASTASRVTHHARVIFCSGTFIISLSLPFYTSWPLALVPIFVPTLSPALVPTLSPALVPTLVPALVPTLVPTLVSAFTARGDRELTAFQLDRYGSRGRPGLCRVVGGRMRLIQIFYADSYDKAASIWLLRLSSKHIFQRSKELLKPPG